VKLVVWEKQDQVKTDWFFPFEKQKDERKRKMPSHTHNNYNLP